MELESFEWLELLNHRTKGSMHATDLKEFFR